MLQDLFPRYHNRYLSLPILGSALEGFAAFLVAEGYPKRVVRLHLRATRKIDERLRGRQCRSIGDITHELLRECAPMAGRADDDRSSSAVVRLLEAYFTKQGMLGSSKVLSPREQRLAEYGRYLTRVRALSSSTIKTHRATASQIFALLDDKPDGDPHARLTAQEVEVFVRSAGGRVSRATLQHTVGQVRSVLRFLATRGEVPVGLDSQIDTPRVYRGEHLPRSLPWTTVLAFLSSIDRSTPIGK